MRGLLSQLVEIISPTRCGGCELPGDLLCDDCRDRIVGLAPSLPCWRCGAPFGWLVCTECWDSEFAFEAARCVAVLDYPLARCVVLHKDAGEQRLGYVLGELAVAAAREWLAWADAITFVPASAEAIRRRGFDHARAIAQPLAASAKVDLSSLLARDRALDQRGLSRSQRAANARDTFSVTGAVPPNVLLVDDVLTTGATLDSAAAVLLDAGARCVRGVVVARAW